MSDPSKPVEDSAAVPPTAAAVAAASAGTGGAEPVVANEPVQQGHYDPALDPAHQHLHQHTHHHGPAAKHMEPVLHADLDAGPRESDVPHHLLHSSSFKVCL